MAEVKKEESVANATEAPTVESTQAAKEHDVVYADEETKAQVSKNYKNSDEICFSQR